MAYCSNCGAYIPDGQTKCPSCGVDALNPPKAPNVDVGEGFKAAEKQKTSTSERTGETATADKPVSEAAKNKNSKTFAVLSYFGILCILPFLICKGDDFALYHGKQGVLLMILSAVLNLIGKLFNSSLITLIIEIVVVYLAVKGILNAYHGKKEPLPYIGQYAEKF